MHIKQLLFLLFSITTLVTCTTKNTGTPDDTGLFIKLLGGSKNDMVSDAFLNEQGEVIGVGSTQSFPANAFSKSSIFLFKTDKFGNKIWYKSFEGLEGVAVRPTIDGYTIFGSEETSAPVNKGLKLIKTDTNGDAKLAISLSTTATTKAVSLGVLANGNYIVLGEVYIETPNIAFSTKNYTAKLSGTTGAKITEKTYSVEGFAVNTPYAMRTMGNQKSIIAGTGNGQARLILIDDELGVEWDYFYATHVNETSVSFTDVQVTANGYICAGSVYGTKELPFIVKTDFAGGLQWKKSLTMDSNVAVKSIDITQDGGYILTGAIEIKEGENLHTNIWVGKINSTGELEWQKNFGGRKNDVGKCIKTTPTGDYALLGNVTFETNQMIALIRIDKNGNLIKE